MTCLIDFMMYSGLEWLIWQQMLEKAEKATISQSKLPHWQTSRLTLAISSNWGKQESQGFIWLVMNSMKLVIPLHSLYWSIRTKDESKCGTAFAFIFGVNWPCTVSGRTQANFILINDYKPIISQIYIDNPISRSSSYPSNPNKYRAMHNDGRLI